MPCPSDRQGSKVGRGCGGGRTAVGDQVALDEALDELGVLELLDIDLRAYRIFLRTKAWKAICSGIPSAVVTTVRKVGSPRI